MRAPHWIGVVGPLVALACGGSSPVTNPCHAIGGDGLDPNECLLPWPSSQYVVTDTTTPTGFRIDLPVAAMPSNDEQAVVDPSAWNLADGFSPMTTLLAEFDEVIDPSQLATWHDPSPSLGSDSQTVIVDVDTGVLVEHFAEVETAPDVGSGTTELYIRPALRLAEGHHYAVAIRDLKTMTGDAVAASPVFAALRDHEPTALPAARTQAYEHDVFAPLVAAGVSRSSLQLAWDFRTASGQNAWSDLVSMRDQAFAMAGSAGIGCTVSSVMDLGSGMTQVEGTFTVPSFLDGSNRIARDASGNPAVEGMVEAPWIAIVPGTARTGSGARPLWLYGHGLFSDRTEVTRDFGWATTGLAGAVAVATDYTGLTLADEGSAVSGFLNLSVFPQTIDQLRQGIVNTLLLPRTFAGACVAQPQLQGSAALPELAPSGWGYFGNSMGGTFGPVIAALSPDVHIAGIGVGGMDFAVMMPRTHEWTEIQAFYAVAYPERVIRDLLLVMSQTTWDFAESSTFGSHVLSDPLPESSTATMMYQIGLYDCDTTNIASEIAARTLAIPELTPSVHDVPGLTAATGSQTDAYIVYDEGASPLPDGTLPPPIEDGVHECVRRDARAQQQLATFLTTGVITDTCGGACGSSAATAACRALFEGP